MGIWIDAQMDRWIDGLMVRWTDGRMDRWIDGYIYICMYMYMYIYIYTSILIVQFSSIMDSKGVLPLVIVETPALIGGFGVKIFGQDGRV